MTGGASIRTPESLSTWGCAQGSLNTGALNGKDVRVVDIVKGSHSEASPGGRARSYMEYLRSSMTFMTCGTRDGLRGASHRVTES